MLLKANERDPIKLHEKSKSKIKNQKSKIKKPK
jgi:hypothetical protein